MFDGISVDKFFVLYKHITASHSLVPPDDLDVMYLVFLESGKPLSVTHHGNKPVEQGMRCGIIVN